MEFGVPKLLASYLTNKTKFASINGVKSIILNVKHGTKQASILGLLLYEIYVNDIPNALFCKPRLYANDTCLVIHEHKANTLQKEISANIRNLKIWLDANEQTLNLNKTSCSSIPPSNANKNLNLNPIFNNELLKEVFYLCKYLDVFVIDQLTFKTHIEKLQNKLSCGVGVLWKLCRFLCEETIILLFHASINPHLLYSIPI